MSVPNQTFPAASLLATAIFLVCLAATGLGALIAVMTRRIIRSVCGLAIACLGLAGLYYFLNSPFLALMEILIYIGAVCVTIIFAVMLAEPDEPQDETPVRNLLWSSVGVLISLAVFVGMARLGIKGPWVLIPAPANAESLQKPVEVIGTSLLTTYSLAFELISVALLVAIVGALAIARTGRTKP